MVAWAVVIAIATIAASARGLAQLTGGDKANVGAIEAIDVGCSSGIKRAAISLLAIMRCDVARRGAVASAVITGNNGTGE